MRLRHHIFLGLSRIFESTGVKFAIAGSIPSGEYLSELLDTSKPLGGWEASSAKAGKEVAGGTSSVDPLDDRSASGDLSSTPWL